MTWTGGPERQRGSGRSSDRAMGQGYRSVLGAGHVHPLPDASVVHDDARTRRRGVVRSGHGEDRPRWLRARATATTADLGRRRRAAVLRLLVRPRPRGRRCPPASVSLLDVATVVAARHRRARLPARPGPASPGAWVGWAGVAAVLEGLVPRRRRCCLGLLLLGIAIARCGVHPRGPGIIMAVSGVGAARCRTSLSAGFGRGYAEAGLLTPACVHGAWPSSGSPPHLADLPSTRSSWSMPRPGSGGPPARQVEGEAARPPRAGPRPRRRHWCRGRAWSRTSRPVVRRQRVEQRLASSSAGGSAGSRGQSVGCGRRGGTSAWWSRLLEENGGTSVGPRGCRLHTTTCTRTNTTREHGQLASDLRKRRTRRRRRAPAGFAILRPG